MASPWVFGRFKLSKNSLQCSVNGQAHAMCLRAVLMFSKDRWRKKERTKGGYGLEIRRPDVTDHGPNVISCYPPSGRNDILAQSLSQSLKMLCLEGKTLRARTKNPPQPLGGVAGTTPNILQLGMQTDRFRFSNRLQNLVSKPK